MYLQEKTMQSAEALKLANSGHKSQRSSNRQDVPSPAHLAKSTESKGNLIIEEAVYGNSNRDSNVITPVQKLVTPNELAITEETVTNEVNETTKNFATNDNSVVNTRAVNTREHSVVEDGFVSIKFKSRPE